MPAILHWNWPIWNLWAFQHTGNLRPWTTPAFLVAARSTCHSTWCPAPFSSHPQGIVPVISSRLRVGVEDIIVTNSLRSRLGDHRSHILAETSPAPDGSWMLWLYAGPWLNRIRHWTMGNGNWRALETGHHEIKGSSKHPGSKACNVGEQMQK